MIIIDIFKKNKRENDNFKKIGRDKINRRKERNKTNKGYSNDKRGNLGNQSGLYYRLPKNKQNTVMSIIAVLEKEN